MSIVWLASYPKSGNTWVRAFLANALAGRDEPVPLDAFGRYILADHPKPHYQAVTQSSVEALTPAEINRLRPLVHHKLAERGGDGGVVLVKTHSMITSLSGVPSITAQATAGAVYILRNPLDVAVSFAKHFGATLDAAVSALSTKTTMLAGSPDHVFQPIGSWSGHATSWLDARGLKVHLMRYETMMAEPQSAFSDLMAFLKLPQDSDVIARAIAFSSFKSLQGQEASTGFHERPATAERFFRQGETGGWRKHLSTAQVRTLIEANRKVMQRFGYLDAAGEPVDQPADMPDAAVSA